MRDGALPTILLCLIAGMLLARAERRAVALCVLLLIGSALAVSALPVPLDLRPGTAIICWGLVLVGALGILLGRPVATSMAMIFALATGLVTGAMTAVVGRSSVLALSLPWIAIWFPAILFVSSGRALILKVVASWIMTVALLSTGVVLSQGISSGSDHLD